MSTWRIIPGDVRASLATLPEGSVRCCVTSPPYFGLRDYGHDGQIGLEASPAAYIETMVEVFRAVRRVLADDGTLWVNMGDSYAGNKPGGTEGSTLRGSTETQNASKRAMTTSRRRDNALIPRSDRAFPGLKPKDLMMMPARVALALQADGWYLRSDIVWSKPNPMPESVTDRPTKAHEYLFLLAKSERYYYDADAIAEECSPNTHSRTAKMPDGWATHAGGHGSFHKDGREKGKRAPGVNPKAAENSMGNRQNASFSAAIAGPVEARNNRDVWTIATQPYKEAHFATFPEDLVEPCILAGSAVGDTVLDPFSGSGTTGAVAVRHGRNYIGCELNPAYIKLSEKRIGNEAPLFVAGGTA